MSHLIVVIKSDRTDREASKTRRKLENWSQKSRRTPWRHPPLDAGRYYYNVTLNINAFTTRCVVITRPLHRSPMALTLSAPLPTGVPSPTIPSLLPLLRQRPSIFLIYRTLFCIFLFLTLPLSIPLLSLSRETPVCFTAHS